ncbi:MAG: hypothetical protein Q8N85_06110 [Candidatus Omnitrophota bacterium]|nr:hypothetical protein [Candidatus Omnitrophota bacterium]
MDSRQMSKHRVITMLDRQEMEFLDKLGKDALFSTGHKLSYNEILKGLIDTAMESGVSGENVDSLPAFKEKLLAQIRQIMQKEERDNGGAK